MKSIAIGVLTIIIVLNAIEFEKEGCNTCTISGKVFASVIPRQYKNDKLVRVDVGIAILHSIFTYLCIQLIFLFQVCQQFMNQQFLTQTTHQTFINQLVNVFDGNDKS